MSAVDASARAEYYHRPGECLLSSRERPNAEDHEGDIMTAHKHPLEKILESRIAIIDGAMGTTIRTYGMTENDIRG